MSIEEIYAIIDSEPLDLPFKKALLALVLKVEALEKPTPNEPEVKAQGFDEWYLSKKNWNQPRCKEWARAAWQAALSWANADITKETQSFDTSQTLNENVACGEFDIWFKKQYPNEGLRNHIDGGGEYYNFARNMNKAFLAGQKSKAAVLKLPERKKVPTVYDKNWDCCDASAAIAFNAALDEVARINEGEIEMTQAEKKSSKLTESQIEHILHVLHNEIQFYNANGDHDNYNFLRYIETALRTKWENPLL